jgi:hypothetical protein
MRTTIRRPKQSKGLIRSLNRSQVRNDKGPLVTRKTKAPAEGTVCERCGAAFVRKTWRRATRMSAERPVSWGICPACQQVGRLEGQGRIVLSGTGVIPNEDLIRRRIRNIEERAMNKQPERRVVSVTPAETGAGKLEVLTTSQKLAHRIVHELTKLLGGRATYAWKDDGSLFATWHYNLPLPRNRARV